MALDEAHESLLGLLCLRTPFLSFVFLYSFGPFSLLLVFSFGFFLDFDSFSKKSGKFLRTGSGAGSVIGLLDPRPLLTPQLPNDSRLGVTSPFNIGVFLSFKSGVNPSLGLGFASAFNLGVKSLTRFGVALFELVVFLSRRLDGVPANLRFEWLVFILMFETSESGDAGGLSGPSYNFRPTGRGITSEVKEENCRGVGGGEWGGGDREGLWGREVL